MVKVLAERWQNIEEISKQLAQGKRGLWGVAIAAFLESSVLPFPIELVLVATYLSHRDRAWRFATAALVGCLVASALFYGVGWLLYENVGNSLSRFLEIEDQLVSFKENINHGGFWLIFTISFLPLPLQAATLGSGAFGYPFVPFLLAIALSRLARFHGLAIITLLAGKRLQTLLRGRSALWRMAAFIGSILLLLLVSWLVFKLS